MPKLPAIEGMPGMRSLTIEAPEELVRRRFEDAGIPIDRLETRRFPGEVIVVVFTSELYLADAVNLANELDSLIEQGFVTVKKSEREQEQAPTRSPTSIDDARISALIELLLSRSRTSEVTPSLKYVRDLAGNLNSVKAPRHHLIFGRRGVGKTALLVEAKRLLEQEGDLVFWTNLQTLRNFNAVGAFLEIASRLCDLPSLTLQERRIGALSLRKAEATQSRIGSIRGRRAALEDVQPVVADLHEILRVLSAEQGGHIYLFIDDMHYMSRSELPLLLDMLHALTRDNRVWIKAAGIRHQCKWFSDNPPMGLQSGHDAQIISLDMTLEEPEKARQFLWQIFRTYAEEARVRNISRFLGNKAVDRLVLASGGVPRDFLTLSGAAIQITRQREKARITGVQDVNKAAGQAADVKLRELEEDAAASIGGAELQIGALNAIRKSIVEEGSYTFFRIDLREKELRARAYDVVQGIMDLRLLHLINSGVSDSHLAGRRYEVYMLDLSQYTGTRFRQRLVVLDFDGGTLVQRKTRSKDKPFRADTARKRVQILRNSPVFDLEQLRGDV
jgi:AAA ATPase domain